MKFEEALAIITAAIAPASLSDLQVEIFRRTWARQSYYKMAMELSHEYGYIKDVGAELWKLLSQTFGSKVTKLNLQETLMQAVFQEQTPKLPAPLRHTRVDWGEAVDVSHFWGRQKQLNILKQWVILEGCKLIAVVGMGGIGKTMFVTQLAEQLANTAQFEIVVWRSLRQAPLLIDLLTELMQSIEPDQSLSLSTDARMGQLLEQLHHHRCLLVLDNIEAVLSGKELVGTYRPGYENYGLLFKRLAEGRHQSSILLTSREIPAEVSIAFPDLMRYK